MPQGVTDGELVSQPWSTDFMLVKAHVSPILGIKLGEVLVDSADELA